MVLQDSYFLITKTLILLIIFFAAHTVTIFWTGLYDEAIAPLLPTSYHHQWRSQDFTLGGADFKFLYKISQIC